MGNETGLVALIQQGGFLMLPILLCSIVSLSIVLEKFWSLQTAKVLPAKLPAMLSSWLKKSKLDKKKLDELKRHSPLGRVIVAGIKHASNADRQQLKAGVEAAIFVESHQMERYLNTLGTVAAITPLLGLLGTVIGMIDVFSMIVLQGTGDATILAGGISKALVTTAGGLFVAIPSLFFHRFFVRKIEECAMSLEETVMTLIDNAPSGSLNNL